MTNYEFKVTCVTDANTSVENDWVRKFDNAWEAVNCFNSFVDHGICVLDRQITLTEPNGATKVKLFKYPYGSEQAYQEACERWRVLPQPVETR